jgi:hypothetical protein
MKNYPANRVILNKDNSHFKNKENTLLNRANFPVNPATMVTHSGSCYYSNALIPKKQTVQNPPRRKVIFISNLLKLNLIKDGIVSVKTPYDTNK